MKDDQDITSRLDGDFYYIRVSFEVESINQRGHAMDYTEQLQDGNIFHLYELEDDRLFFPDGKMKDGGGQGLVTVSFDFQWLEGLVQQLDYTAKRVGVILKALAT